MKINAFFLAITILPVVTLLYLLVWANHKFYEKQQFACAHIVAEYRPMDVEGVCIKADGSLWKVPDLK